MFRPLMLALSVAAFAGSASAQVFQAENRVLVTPAGGNSFAIPSGGHFGARGVWCAAADYARDVLGQPGTARLYVQQPKTTPSGVVVFGLDPAGAQPAAVSSTSAALRAAGSNLSIDHAVQFCVDARIYNRR